MPDPVMFGPEFDRCPFPAYAELRTHSPVQRLELPGDTWSWLLTRHADVVAAMEDPRLSKRPTSAAAHWFEADMGLPADHRGSLRPHMNNEDGGEHSRLRKACAGAFGPRRLQGMRDRTRELANVLLDKIEARGRGDLVDEFAYPLGMTTICELIGIPESLREAAHQPAMVVAAGDTTDMPQMLKATDDLDKLLTDVVALKRETPGADLISDLLKQVYDGRLRLEEVGATAFLVLIAGHETTVSLIASTALTLVTHPDAALRARDDTTYLTQVVEEVLRRDSPLRNTSWRFATEEFELGGQRIQPGDPVLLSLLSANHDPEVFADPEEFQPGRDRRHIAFGLGPHLCIGAALARLQAATAITTLLRRLPALRLTTPEDELTWWPSAITRGLDHLPVAL